ncbi:MAG: signal peptidase I [Ruminococcus sp.]|nr:signal peptidase I [Ruminococcus sp.]
MNRYKPASSADMPTIKQLKAESEITKHKIRFRKVLKNTIFTLVTVSAAAVLIAALLLPVLRIYGTSMDPTLSEGDIVISVKSSSFETGEVVAFYYNNKILVKRVIAHPGDWVDINDKGIVFVNDQKLSEPYVSEFSLGDCDIELPYQIPESRLFVMGDHRDVSVDSRNTSVGCVAEEQIVGKIVFKVWPLSGFGKV